MTAEFPAHEPSAPAAFDLPTARQVVGRGFQLALDASTDIRAASLYVGLVLLLVLAPLIVTVAVELPRLLAVPWDDLGSMPQNEVGLYIVEVLGPLFGLFWLAVLGFISISVDGTLMALALLGGRATGRPIRLREALQRSRQTFWRFGAAAFVVGLISQAITLSGLALMGGFTAEPSIGSSLLVVFVSTLVTAPFGYYATGIVLGDASGVASLGRSARLARARPRLAAVVAAFAFAASALQTFGLGAALDVAEKIASATHPTFGPQGPAGVLVVATLGIATVAFGSLIVTVNAIVVAPQVIAFLGLTHFAAGLDAAREPLPAPTPEPLLEPAGAPEALPEPQVARTGWDVPAEARHRPARWISLPMLALIGLSVVGAASALAVSPELSSPPAESLIGILRAHAGGRSVELFGSQRVVHPVRAAVGSAGAVAEAFPSIVSGEYARVQVVPAWLLDEVFDCADPNVACSRDGHPAGAFDQGAWLFAQTMAAPPDLAVNGAFAEAGPILRLAEYEDAPADARYPLGNTAVTTTWRSSSRDVSYHAYEDGSFADYETYARSAWVGRTLLTLLPIKDELEMRIEAWDAYAYQLTAATGGTSDSLRGTGARLLPIVGAPLLIFQEASAAPSR